MKKILKVLPVVIIMCVVFTSVLGFGTDPKLENIKYDETVVNGNIKSTVQNVWATIALLVQIASVAAVVFAGLRYMFASADQKADIKQGLTYLAIGAVLIFGAVSIIQLVAGAASVLNTTN